MDTQTKKYNYSDDIMLKKEKYKLQNQPPKRSTLEEIGNSITHGVGAIFGIVALILLLIKSTETIEVVSAVIYGVSLITMMLTSCLYHAFKTGSTVKRIFRRFDYSGIYLLIVGTFTPLFLVYASQPVLKILFVLQGLLMILGITFVSIFGPERIKRLNFIMYFAIGWSGVLFIPEFIENNIRLLHMILGRRILYTLGMIPFTLNFKSAHFIWHFFVLCGAIIHFLGIYSYVY